MLQVIFEDYFANLGASAASRQVVLSHAHPVPRPLSNTTPGETFTGLLDFMCSNVPSSKAVIALVSTSTGSNANLAMHPQRCCVSR